MIRKNIFSLCFALVVASLLVIGASAAGQIYDQNGIKTAYVASTDTITTGENTYNTYPGITAAISGLNGNEGTIIIASDVTEASFDGLDKKGRGKVTIQGLTGSEVYTLSSGQFRLEGDTEIGNVKFILPWCYFYASGELILHDDFVLETNGSDVVYFATDDREKRFPSRIIVNSGKFRTFHALGVYGNIPENSNVYVELGGNAFVDNDINIGYGEKDTTSVISGNAVLVINADVSRTKKIYIDKSKTPTNATNAFYTLILNHGLADTYTITNDALVYLDYIVKSGTNGKVEVYAEGKNPTLELIPGDGLVPFVNGNELTANDEGKFLYTLSAAGTFDVTYGEHKEITKVYEIDGVTTVFVANTETVSIDGQTYYTFSGLIDAIKGLEKREGTIIVVSDVTEAQFDGFDIKGRGKVTIKGLTGNELYTLQNGHLRFEAPAEIDNITFRLPYAYLHASGELIIGENYKHHSEGGPTLFSTDDREKTLPSKVILNGGTYRVVNVAGCYGNIPNGASVYVEIGKNAQVTTELNLGYGEKDSNSVIEGNVTLVIGGDIATNKIIKYNTSKSPDGKAACYSVIFNNGCSGLYSFDETASAVVDYVIKSAEGGRVTLKSPGSSTLSPTFLLIPDEGKIPCFGGLVISDTDGDGEFVYTPALANSLTEYTVTWVQDYSNLEPEVFTYNGKSAAVVKSGKGYVEIDGTERSAYPDINSATAALGASGGYIFISGTAEFITGEADDTNTFRDITGREKLTILGVDGTNPKIIYYRSMSLKGELEMDNLTYHLGGEYYDSGIVTRGFNLTLGENFKTSTVFKNNMSIHVAHAENATFANPCVITVNGGTLSRLAAGATYNVATVKGDVIMNIGGNAYIENVFGGSHGGASGDTILDGNVEINIDGGHVTNLYTGVNQKTGITGDVTVNISAGDFTNAKIYHGSVLTSGTYIDGNSVINITGGTFDGAILSTSGSDTISGIEAFIVSDRVSGYRYTASSKSKLIVYDADDTEVYPAYVSDGTFEGYEIVCHEDDGALFIDDEIVQRTEDGIYEIAGNGEHSVMFSKLRTITFDANGAQGTVPQSMDCYDGVTATLPDVGDLSIYSYEFVGWNTDKNAETGFMSFIPPSEDVTLYAIWTGISPELCENSNISANGVSYIRVNPISPDEYETNEEIGIVERYLGNDSVVINGYEIAYSFTLNAFDEKDQKVTNLPNGVDIRIPKSLIIEISAGEALRLFAVESDTAELVQTTQDEKYIYATIYGAGNFTVVKTNALYGKYTYVGRLSDNNKYVLTLSFEGAKANYGSFGISYDTANFALDSFVFSDIVTEAGRGEGVNFETYLDSDGIYRNSWSAKNGGYVDAGTSKVTIGTFTFSVKATGSASLPTIDKLFAVALPTDENFTPSDSVNSGSVYSDGVYVYSPHVASTEVYCQPIETEFTLAKECNVTLSYALEREQGDSYVYEENGYDGRGKLVVKTKAGADVCTVYEDACNITYNSQNKAVLGFVVALADGEYSATFEKNGYVSHLTEIAVAGEDVAFETVVLTSGDICNSYEESVGDGLIDIDDFIRVLRGFASEASSYLRMCVDINEDGNVSVSDLAIIKKNFGK